MESSARQWTLVASAGDQPPNRPDQATLVLPLTDQELLALRGPDLTAEEREILAAFAAQLANALESDRLHAGAAEAEGLARANQLRSALLAAVSHDLRTPLASIKAASSSLLSDQLTFGPDETRILLKTIDEESDRLNSLVENLLDMSRLQAGSMEVLNQSTDVHDVVEAARASLGPRGQSVAVDVSSSLPRVGADPVLLERAVANLIDNALIHAGGSPPTIEAGQVAGRIDVRIIDRGPGIPRAERERVFQPFQRLGDSSTGIGVGLGLAVARGFVEVVGGELDAEDTPGGGCTMVIRIPEFESDQMSAKVPPSPAPSPLLADVPPSPARPAP
jgi:two-component system sensor histidine kinase KdpD